MTGTRRSDLALYRRCLAEARPYWLHLLALFLLSLLATPMALLAPLPLKIAVDSVLGEEPLPRLVAPVIPAAIGAGAILFFAAVLMVAIAILTQVQRLAVSVLYTETAEKLVMRFRSTLFQHVQRLSMLFHDRTDSTESAYRVLWDGAAIRHVALDGITPFVTAGFTLTAVFYVIFRLDHQLALLALGVAPVLFLLSRGYRRRLRGRWSEVKSLEARGLSIVHEVLSAIQVVQAFGQESREHQRFMDHSTAGARARVRATLTANAYGVQVALTTTLGTAAVLFLGVRHVQVGTLTLGELLMVMTYLGQLYGPLQSISKNLGGMQAHLSSAERALALLDEAPDVVEQPNARRLTRVRGELTLDDVSFAYADRHNVLEWISLHIPAGSRVGIVGPTGAGKTTLVSLLLRFYDPSSGTIMIDGVDLRRCRIDDLRNQFSMVPQEPLVFSAAIAENIAYARPGAGRDAIAAAAKAANADDFIRALPEGYDTVLGERGARLSGGERQRVALARAFLKDAPILILDEPTSALDLKTEGAILEALERLVEGRTTLVIAHRPSTLVHCNLVVRIETGRVMEVTRGPATAVPTASRAWPGSASSEFPEPLVERSTV